MAGTSVLVLAILLCVAVFGPTIWLSLTAKPIGYGARRQPYRWGARVALASAITSVSFLPPALIAIGLAQPFVAIENAIALIALVATCLLLLNRKRLGVVRVFSR